MEAVQNALLPFTAVFIIITGLYKKLPVFEIFLSGAKKALKQTTELLPALTALTLAVAALTSSGGTQLLTDLLSPLVSLTGFPPEVIPLCIISPLSGSGSIAVLESILRTHSPDSYTGRLASVIAGASETTFYAVAVYYGSVGITKLRHTLPSALAADMTSYVAAAFFCRM